ncbi:hypothetical protein GCM10028773_25020 [Spirosoma koreense]
MLQKTVRRSGLIAAIAPNGPLYVMGQDQPFTSEDIGSFVAAIANQTWLSFGRAAVADGFSSTAAKRSRLCYKTSPVGFI